MSLRELGHFIGRRKGAGQGEGAKVLGVKGPGGEEGSGGVGDLGQTECTQGIWSAVSLTFPPLPQPRASSALWDNKGRESHAAHWGIRDCYHVMRVTIVK